MKAFKFLISKSKQWIRTSEHDFHIKISLETKFYIFIFILFLLIFVDRYKIIVLDGTKLSKNSDFISI